MLAALAAAPAAESATLLDVLVSVGGPKALKAVSAAATDADPAIRDAAYAALGKWTRRDAGPELLVLAKARATTGSRSVPCGAYIRVARQFSIPEPPADWPCTARSSRWPSATKKSRWPWTC